MRLPSPSETAAQAEALWRLFTFQIGQQQGRCLRNDHGQRNGLDNKIFEAPDIPTNNFREKVCSIREKVCSIREKVCSIREKVCSIREKVCNVKKYNALYIREISPLLQLFQNVIPKSYSK